MLDKLTLTRGSISPRYQSCSATKAVKEVVGTLRYNYSLKKEFVTLQIDEIKGVCMEFDRQRF